jgi:hypothetical protein
MYSVTAWLPPVGFEDYARWYARSRPVPLGTQRGDLAALIAASMPMVTLREGHTAIAIPRMRVAARTVGQRVVLEMNDARSIRRIFASRPTHVSFYEYVPGQAPRTARVAVTYLDQ